MALCLQPSRLSFQGVGAERELRGYPTDGQAPQQPGGLSLFG